MAIPHAKSGDVIDVRPLGAALAGAQTTTLVKTPTLEVLRLVIPSGKEVCHQHALSGEITVHCLEGRIAARVDDQDHDLEAGQLIYLAAGAPHTFRGVEDATALLTILLR